MHGFRISFQPVSFVLSSLSKDLPRSSLSISRGLLSHAASLVFLAAPTRAGIVAAGLADECRGVCRAHHRHEFFRRLPCVRQLAELCKIGFAMRKELL